MANVSEIADAELLRRAVCTAKPRRKGPRWTAVSELFCLGSTYSAQLCERFGINPDEQVKP